MCVYVKLLIQLTSTKNPAITALWEYKEERKHVQETAHVEKNANGVK